MSMTQREKVLAFAVGGVVAILVNLFLISFFLKHQRALASERAEKQLNLTGMQILLTDADLWQQRDVWLRAKQPPLLSEAKAGDELLQHVRKVAQDNTVLIDQPPSIRNVERRPQYVSASIELETKSTWEALLNFLHALQGPDRFIVFETATLRQDPQDKTQMRGKFRIAKWYAPKT